MSRDAAPRARRSRLGAPLRDSFYDRPTEIVSRELLGAVLECTTAEGVTRGVIVETEAYLGPDDPARHAVAGVTARTEHLFGPPGRAYVYLIYGMYWCFNAVTRERGHGSAVLVRAVSPSHGIELMRRRRPRVKRDRDLTNGPGKLCLAMGIDGGMTGASLRTGPIVVRQGSDVADDAVVVTPRIGITRAAEWPLRYLVRDDPYVSATPPSFPRTPFAP
jgi:DNA-3-methyladenine glycosylase